MKSSAANSQITSEFVVAPVTIAGKQMEPATSMPVTNPARFEEVVGQVALGRAADAEAAVEAADKEYHSWSALNAWCEF